MLKEMARPLNAPFQGPFKEIVDTFDWATTPLGSPRNWPPQLRTLVEVMLSAVQPMFIAWGPERTLIYNEGYVPMLGSKHPQAFGSPFMEVWAEAVDDLTPLFDRVFAGEPIYMDDITLMLHRADRLEEAHFSFSYTPVRGADGCVEGLFCPCSETTPQVFAERDRAWKNSPDLLVVLDLAGVCHAINPAVRAFGYDPSDIIGSSLQRFVWLDDKSVVWAAFAATLAGEPVANFEARFVDSTGCPKWISWHTTFEHNLVYAYGRDVTVAKAQAQAMKDVEDQLRQAQKLEAVGQLTGGIAHDFNNILTVIRSSADFLRRPDLAEARRSRYVDAITDTIDRASKLTSQLLAFARRQPLSPTAFDVANRIEVAAAVIRPLLGARVRLDLDLCKPSCLAYADAAQFEAALINLAINANEAMGEEGSIIITAELSEMIPAVRGEPERPGDFIAVSVSDVGSGIQADKLDAIFEPFYTTKEISKGAGLGLSQVYGFAKQSSGDIIVSSQLAFGSCFTLYLPRAEGAVEDHEAPQTARREEDGGALHVLIVEDDKAVGQLALEMLTDLGYRAQWVVSGFEALSVLERSDQSFNVVFSDVLMPGMTGIELSRVIGARHPGLPVLLTSGYSRDLAENDADRFQLLAKPYSASALAEALKAVTSQEEYANNVDAAEL